MIPGSNKDHPSFLKSFSYAMEGFVTAVKTERNIKVMLVAGVCTVIAGCIVGLDIAEWATIIICCGLVIHGELCNTAMEAIVDLATQELHPLAKRAKDIAAASVYVLSITAAIVGVLVFAHALGFIRKGFPCPTICSLPMRFWTTSPRMLRRPRPMRKSRSSTRLRA